MKKALSFISLIFVITYLAVTVIKFSKFVPTQFAILPTPTQSFTAMASPSASVLGVVTKTSHCAYNGPLPDGACTPGAVDQQVTQSNIRQTICMSGYSTSVRPQVAVTNTIKSEQMAAYGDSDSKANYELDHLISLELGGCPDCVANLWPQPYNGNLNAHQKDTVENYLHKEVCNGSIPLQTAQEEIAHDWVSVYNSMPK